ncbi:MAG TPA: hypothetical protein P5016_05620 [Verrucomicrobiales bacterium]|nr:hypothetical protein [Verrucomicrobiales bacterium]
MQTSDTVKNPAAMGNPFLHDVFQPGFSEVPGVADLHASAMTQCVRVFEELVRQGEVGATWGNTGRTLLIAAPRAGYGKTHLISRLEAVTGGLVATLPLPLDPARPVTWEGVLQSVLRLYGEKRCSQYACSLLDEAARYFAAQLLLEAAKAGAIRPGEMPADEASLSTRFRAAFDPASVGSASAWFIRHGNTLLPGAERTLGRRWDMRPEMLEFWCEVVQAHFSGSPGSWDGLNILRQAEARDALGQFLRIASECRSVAFVADHLDGFFGSATAGMEIAEVITTLRQVVPRSVTLLCLNRDVWNSIFDGRIPSAWVDRLTGESMVLGDVPVEIAASLVKSRLATHGQVPAVVEAFWEFLARREQWQAHAVPQGLSPREVLRKARPAWDEWVSLGRDGQNQSRISPVPAPTVPQSSTNTIKSPRFPGSLGGPAKSSPFEIDTGHLDAPAPPVQDAPQTPISVPAPAKEKERESSAGVSVDRPVVVTNHVVPAPASALRDIDAIISEIRRGSRVVSDSRPTDAGAPRNGTGRPTNGHGTPTGTGGRSPEIPSAGVGSSPATGPVPSRNVAPSPPATSGGGQKNPFWVDHMGAQLDVLHREVLNKEQLGWEPQRIYRLVRTVAPYLAGLTQTEQNLSGGVPCLSWDLGNDHALIGFAPLKDGAYWTQVVRAELGRARNAAPGSTAKVVVFSHRLAPFLFESLRNVDVDRGLAMRIIDPVELNDTDLARLYACEQLLGQADKVGKLPEASRFVARHLENFWRRLLRPSQMVESSLH